MKQVMIPMVLVALAFFGGSGCKDDPNPCDSTTYLSGSDCLPKTDAAALPETDSAGPGTDTPAPAAPEVSTAGLDSGGGEATVAATSLLGAPCTDNVTHAECQGPDTNYCAIQPGSAGYCTKSGCVTNADCPTNWTCFDLSKMGITGYPAMCTKPVS
jgi:hypothetical protein